MALEMSWWESHRLEFMTGLSGRIITQGFGCLEQSVPSAVESYVPVEKQLSTLYPESA